MLQLNKKPKDYNSLFFGDADIARLDIGGDAYFKKLSEQDEANFWGLNIVSCSNDKWSEIVNNDFICAWCGMVCKVFSFHF